MKKTIYTAKKTSGSVARGNWIRPEKRLAIYLRDNFHCVYCNKDLAESNQPDMTLDHIKVRSAGGNNHESNLITACRSCNSTRGNKKICDWADVATRKTIHRNTARKLGRYLIMAKSIIAGKCNDSNEDRKV